MNASRWALYHRLLATGLPGEVGTGGRTKWNRTARGLPKTHWLDAACVGASTPITLQVAGIAPLLIRACGHGNRQMCGADPFGFPMRHRTRHKRFFGFQTGDLVRATVPTPLKTSGVHVGRVLVRASGSFDVQTKHVRVQGITAVPSDRSVSLMAMPSISERRRRFLLGLKPQSFRAAHSVRPTRRTRRNAREERGNGSCTTGEGFAAIVPMHAPAMLRVATALIRPATPKTPCRRRRCAPGRRRRCAPGRRGRRYAILTRRVPGFSRSQSTSVAAGGVGLKGRQEARLQPLPDDDEPSLALLAFNLGSSDHAGALDLRAAVNALPVQLRTVVALRFYAGLDATEIGEALSIPAGTVRSRLHRALLRLPSSWLAAWRAAFHSTRRRGHDE